MRRTAALIVGSLLLADCAGRNVALRQLPVRTLQLTMDSRAIKDLQQGAIPAAREFLMPLPDGTRPNVVLTPAGACGTVAGQRALSGRASSGGQEWYVKVIGGSGVVHVLVIGDREAWSYTVTDADLGILQARPVNPPQALCSVPAEAQIRQRLLNIGDAAWPRQWPATPYVFRFAISATFDFISRFPETERVASRNVHMASAFFEKWHNVSFCPVVNAGAFETVDDSIYTGDEHDKRAAAHALFRKLDLQFDLGQVFEVGGNSYGEPSGLCTANAAGQGITAWRSKEEENVWLVVHEAAHQLGATHTFNGNYPGRSPDSAVELAEGRSVLGYPSERSQVWFHPLSVAQVLTHVQRTVHGSATCGSRIGPIAPTAPELDDRLVTVPLSTGIELDASARGAATQYAIAEVTTAQAPKSTPPWFYAPPSSTSPLFTFPSAGEQAPDRAGDLRFMAMARDADGSIGFAFHTVRVIPSLAPPPPR